MPYELFRTSYSRNSTQYSHYKNDVKESVKKWD